MHFEATRLILESLRSAQPMNTPVESSEIPLNLQGSVRIETRLMQYGIVDDGGVREPLSPCSIANAKAERLAKALQMAEAREAATPPSSPPNSSMARLQQRARQQPALSIGWNAQTRIPFDIDRNRQFLKTSTISPTPERRVSSL